MPHAESASKLTAGRDAPESGPASGWRSHRGQVLVIFSGIFVVLLLMSALVIDLAWLWNNSLRIQRSADAAALAGVVYLPNNFNGAGSGNCYNALTCARNEAGRNGYTNGLGGITVTPTQDLTNNRRLNVKVTAPVQTFFLGLIGMNQVIISRTAHAEYVLPVPMGSPENYYGVFGKVRDATFTTSTTSTSSATGASQTAGPQNATTAPAGTPWTTSSGTLPNAITTNDNIYARTSTDTATQQWSGFGFLTGATPPITAPIGSGNPTTTINIIGLQIGIQDSFVSAACANSTIGIALSWNGGTTWSTQVNTPTLGTSITAGDYTLGNNNNTTPWGAHAWTRNDFSDTNFRVRATANKGCATGGTTLNIDLLQPSVFFTITTNTTTTTVTTSPAADYDLHGPGAACPNLAANCYLGTPAAGGQPLNARGFWATMNTEGAFNSNGDAFQPYYDSNNSPVTPALACPATAKACYGPDDYYNYAIEMQPNTTGGYVYIFDPVYCRTLVGSGTGDRLFSGVSSTAVSSFYELYSDDLDTPFIRTDDTLRATSGSTFRTMAFQDSTMNGGSASSECKQSNVSYGDERDYHDSWFLLNPGYPLTGGPNGTTYRVHTTGTDPSNVTQQRGTDGEQSFAIYATSAEAQAGGAACRVLVPPSSCGYPRVYGLGAMQAFTPLESVNSPSEFYLAQIDPIHLGKTLEIRLWDPGDTGTLSAWIAILIPDITAPGGYRAASVTYSAAVGTTNSQANSACNSNKRTVASAALIQTSDGSSQFFNGCWLTIDTVIPAWYTGNSTLPTDYAWWKIRYTMTGSGVSNDVTTWMADIRGNPVHLVEP